MQYDTSLIKVVHDETYKGFKIWSNLSRFGGLYVCVHTNNNEYLHDTDNILDARNFIDAYISKNQKAA